MKSLNVHGKKSKELLERDHAVISPSCPRACPYAMDHGKGSEVGDKDGNRFTDFASGIAVCSTNHSHPKVIESLKNTSDKFVHKSSDFYHPVWIQSSERIVATSPFKEHAKVFLGNSGTEAVEAVIKLTRSHTDRKRSIDFFRHVSWTGYGITGLHFQQDTLSGKHQPNDELCDPRPVPRRIPTYASPLNIAQDLVNEGIQMPEEAITSAEAEA